MFEVDSTDHMFSAGRVRKGPAPVRPIKFSLLFSSTYSSPPVKLRDSSVRIQRGGGQACHRVNCNAYFCLRTIEKCAFSPHMCTVLLSHSLILHYSQRQNNRKQIRYSKHAIITYAFMRANYVQENNHWANQGVRYATVSARRGVMYMGTRFPKAKACKGVYKKIIRFRYGTNAVIP